SSCRPRRVGGATSIVPFGSRRRFPPNGRGSRMTATRMAAQVVDVWTIETEELEPDAGRFLELLDSAERLRAERVRFANDGRRFALRRGWLRTVLSTYTGRPAEALRFQLSPHGKPALADPGEPSLEFNLSHSRDLAVLAVASGRRLGVDVEWRDPARDLE